MARKRKIFAFVAVLLLFLCDYLYWTVSLPLADAFSEEMQASVKAQLFYSDDFFVQQELAVDEEMLAAILEAVEQTEVTRRPKFGTMSQPFFRLYLYYPDGYTSMTVVENGEISADPEMTSDRRVYFDGGGELYSMLRSLTS